MANTLLTPSMITKEALMLFTNTNAFIKSINRQYEDQFARDGARIGTQLRIRLPTDYTVSDGPGLQVQDSNQQQIVLTVATQRHVDISFNSVERTMSLDNYSELVLAPMINVLAGNVAATVMGGVEAVSNYQANVDGSSNIVTPARSTWLMAGAYLDSMGAPRGQRKIVLDPWTQARTVDSLAGLFNPATPISDQYKTGEMANALGFDWMMDQTVIKHVIGTCTGATVNGAGQTGSVINVNAITGTLIQGDIVTFASVNSVNRTLKQSNGVLSQHVITQNAANGATSLSIYPPITPPLGGQPVQYQTVTASPANNAATTPVTAVTASNSAGYRKNIGFVPQAVTMVTADLVMPKKAEEVSRHVLDNVSMRFLTDYLIGTDILASRLDVLFGFAWTRPEWAVVIPDAL